MTRKELIKAVAYFRTSSATNAGADKDSEKRQRAAIASFANTAGYDVVDSYKAMVVSKLKGARDRKRATGMKIEGRKSYSEIDAEMIAMARKLRRYKVEGRKRTLRGFPMNLPRQVSPQGRASPMRLPLAPRPGCVASLDHVRIEALSFACYRAAIDLSVLTTRTRLTRPSTSNSASSSSARPINSFPNGE
jgi:hypothetical protein